MMDDFHLVKKSWVLPYEEFWLMKVNNLIVLLLTGMNMLDLGSFITKTDMEMTLLAGLGFLSDFHKS